MAQIRIIRHALAQVALSALRNVETDLAQFRTHTRSIAALLCSEALSNLELEAKQIQTPLQSINVPCLHGDIVAVPVLRAGLSLLEGFMECAPIARVGMVGFARDEKTAIAKSYYSNIPKLTDSSRVFILDPMLATGGTLNQTIDEVKRAGGKHIAAIAVIAAPEGVAAVEREHPDVAIITAALDSHLNAQKYIVPGLGDFGDRYYGTN